MSVCVCDISLNPSLFIRAGALFTTPQNGNNLLHSKWPSGKESFCWSSLPIFGFARAAASYILRWDSTSVSEDIKSTSSLLNDSIQPSLRHFSSIQNHNSSITFTLPPFFLIPLQSSFFLRQNSKCPPKVPMLVEQMEVAIICSLAAT